MTGIERGLELLPQVLGLADDRRGVVGDAAERADEGGGHEPVVTINLRAAGGACVGRGQTRPSMPAPGRASASTASAR